MRWKTWFWSFLSCALMGIWSGNLAAQVVTINEDSVKICPGQTATFSATVSGFQYIDSYVIDTIPYSPDTIGGTALTMTDDDMQGSFPIGFCFEFLDSTYYDFYVCSNGWISFSPNGGGWQTNWSPNDPTDIIPSATGNVPKNAVMGPWVDYQPPVSGTVRYQTVGTAPNRRLVVTWDNCAYFSCGTTFGTTQIVLHESSFVIENHLIASPVCAGWGNGAKTQALHDINGATAYVSQARNGNQWTVNNESTRYTPVFLPAPNASVDIIWESPLGTQVGTGPSITVAPQVDTWYYAIPQACANNVMDSVLVKVGGEEADQNKINVLCKGDSTGSIVVWDTANLPGPLDFYFTDANMDTIQTTINTIFTIDSMGNLPAGTYTVAIIASDGQCASAIVTVDEPTDLIPGVGSLGPTSCNGNFCDGTATGSAFGGTPPYSYIWPGGAVGSATNTLCSGTNHLTVTDAHGCWDTISFPIIEPTAITVNTTGTDTICISNTKNLSAIPAGGSPPYTFEWFNVNSNTSISTSNAVGVNPITTTTYSVTISDANGCPGPVSMETVTVRAPLTVDLASADTICPGDSIDLVVSSSTGGDGFYTYQWTAGLGITDSIRVSPALSTTYFVSLYDGCGSPPDVDSVYVQVGGYPDLFVEIQAEPESLCLGDHTVIRAKGFGGFGGEPERTYTWSDGFIGAIRLETPTQNTLYEVTVTDQCISRPGEDELEVVIGNFPNPTFGSDLRSGCAPLFTDVELPSVDPAFTYQWRFGDGTDQIASQLTRIPYQYTQPGCYDVTLTVTSDIGCVSQSKQECFFEVFPNPKADFEFAPDNPSTADPRVQFRNTSLGSTGTYWEINDPTFIPVQDEDYFEHFFSDAGSFLVTLVAANDFGCTDTLSNQLVQVDLMQTFYIPTAFTPNGDDLNDYFGPIGEGIPVEDFSMTIYDRWGHILFHSDHPENRWNGRDSDGRLVPIDTYPWVIRYRGMDNVMKELTGRVTYAPTE